MLLFSLQCLLLVSRSSREGNDASSLPDTSSVLDLGASRRNISMEVRTVSGGMFSCDSDILLTITFLIELVEEVGIMQLLQDTKFLAL